MRLIALAAAALLLASPLAAQPFPPQPGEVLANRLPDPPVDDDAAPRAFLLAARFAITAGRLGEAQEALERAESRELSRVERPSLAGVPSRQPLVAHIRAARAALAAQDSEASLLAIDAGLGE